MLGSHPEQLPLRWTCRLHGLSDVFLMLREGQVEEQGGSCHVLSCYVILKGDPAKKLKGKSAKRERRVMVHKKFQGDADGDQWILGDQNVCLLESRKLSTN